MLKRILLVVFFVAIINLTFASKYDKTEQQRENLGEKENIEVNQDIPRTTVGSSTSTTNTVPEASSISNANSISENLLTTSVESSTSSVESTSSHSLPAVSSTISNSLRPSENSAPGEEPTSGSFVPAMPNLNRRKITYDQRQEGQYNIRADLENFMIVFIPPNPIAGVNLLDLLARSTMSSSLKRSNSKKHKKKNSLNGFRGGTNRRNNNGNFHEKFIKPQFKIAHKPQMEFFGNSFQQTNYPLFGGSSDIPSARYSEFIEGRTPYRVDISSENSNDFSSILGNRINHPDPEQLDVLSPPPYPLHLQLMKAFHLDGEPNNFNQAPSMLPIAGKFPNLFRDGNFNSDIIANSNKNINYNNKKILKPTNDNKKISDIITDTSRILLSDSGVGYKNNISANRSELSNVLLTILNKKRDKISKKHRYNVIDNTGGDSIGHNDGDDENDDLDRYYTSSSLFDSLTKNNFDAHLNTNNEYIEDKGVTDDEDDGEDDEDDITDEDIYSTQSYNNNNQNKLEDFEKLDNNYGELKLIGATEQCGPDRRRNRFGICQFISNLN